jgi:hypothetical protein
MAVDDVHTPENRPRVSISNVDSSRAYGRDDTISLLVSASGRYPLARAQIYINDEFVTTLSGQPFMYRFSPADISSIREQNTLRVVGIDSIFNRSEVSANFSVNLEN